MRLVYIPPEYVWVSKFHRSKDSVAEDGKESSMPIPSLLYCVKDDSLAYIFVMKLMVELI